MPLVYDPPMALRIIGAGQARTGTTSTKVALEMLGIAPCYHMHELFLQLEHIPLWEQAFDGELDDWNLLLGSYAATLDWPASLFWRELADAQPDAKVLLTERDPDAWCTSFERTVLAAKRTLVPQPDSIGALLRLIERSLTSVFGDAVDDRQAIIATYQLQNQAVRDAFDDDRLLVYDPADGWDPLCQWLGVDRPDAPFPHLNTGDEFRSTLGL